MGTRNLTMVICDKETKVAQYGQWDGYPSGQGATILKFLQNNDLKLFKTKIRDTAFLTEEEIDKINKEGDWINKYPYLSRNVGGSILQYIYDNPPLKLVNQEKFAADSLFCEWAYVIDLDLDTFEIYEGFYKEPLDDKERFYKFESIIKNSEYHPVKCVKIYSLENLPTEDKFLSDLEYKEESKD